MDTVAEVTVRFAGTVLGITRIGPGESFRIGPAPGMDLPLDLATELPLVASTSGGYVVRRPAGMRATIDGTPMPLAAADVRLGPETRIELAFGHVTIAVRRIARATQALTKPAVDRRPWAYAALSLVAHVAFVLAAIRLAEPMRTAPAKASPPRSVHATIAHTRSDPPRPPPPPPVPVVPPRPDHGRTASAPASAARAGARSATSRADARRAQAVADAQGAGILGAGLGDLSMLVPSVDVRALVDDASVHDPAAEPPQSFGGTLRWDPGGTVPVGEYTTVAEGHAAGDDYDLPGVIREERHDPVVVSCTAASACAADGPITKDQIRAAIADHARALLGCYARGGADPAGVRVVLAFEIDRDGAVLRASGRGPAELTACILAVVEKLDFPTALAQTTVSLPIRIGPS